MRKITEEVVGAFLRNKAKTLANTSTNGTTLILHGNAIAWHENDKICITNANWFSNTTKERLNAIPCVSIYQKKGDWYLNGNLWNGKPTLI